MGHDRHNLIAPSYDLQSNAKLPPAEQQDVVAQVDKILYLR